MNELPLKIGERVTLRPGVVAEFDGKYVQLYCTNTIGEPTVISISPEMMAMLFWFNRRVVDDFPEQWAIDLSKFDD